jgi:predicted nucleic acid-binding Zn ribbon protein
MQNFLYKCEVCTVAKFSVIDKGEVWCTDCRGCQSIQFHHKVVIKPAYDMFGVFQGNGFYCKMDKEEKKDENSDTGTD